MKKFAQVFGYAVKVAVVVQQVHLLVEQVKVVMEAVEQVKQG